MPDNPTKEPLLTISARCGASDPCLFDGQDLFIEIEISSTHQGVVGFPLAFVQQAGPSVRLIHARTRADAYLRTNLGDRALIARFTPVVPGRPLVIRWIITADELRSFGTEAVDLFAEITVSAAVEVEGRQEAFIGMDRLRIIEPRRP